MKTLGLDLKTLDVENMEWRSGGGEPGKRRKREPRLMLIGSDMRGSRNDFEEEIGRLGGAIKFINGPWILLTDVSTEEALEKLDACLADVPHRLLAAEVRSAYIGAGRYLGPKKKKPAEGDRVFAVAYTLHMPRQDTVIQELPHIEGLDKRYLNREVRSVMKRHDSEVGKAIEDFAEKSCHPVGAIYLIKANDSPRQLHIDLEHRTRVSGRDELMVFELAEPVQYLTFP